MSKNKLTEKDLVKVMTPHNAHADELAQLTEADWLSYVDDVGKSDTDFLTQRDDVQDGNRLEVAMSILAEWGATPDQIDSILPPDSEDDVDERAYCILSIKRYLRVHFNNPVNQAGFMRMKNNNEFFEGRTPLDIISSGSLTALREVEARIRNIGAW